MEEFFKDKAKELLTELDGQFGKDAVAALPDWIRRAQALIVFAEANEMSREHRDTIHEIRTKGSVLEINDEQSRKGTENAVLGTSTPKT